mgnify:FL=1|tara:strand:+ start:365 stop:502 length:138 start_codon:yes stop_codon:yes gene_type:complete
MKAKTQTTKAKITSYIRNNGIKVYTLEINGKPLKSSTKIKLLINL